MAAGHKQADALVEEGLQLYKAGNLDAALARWTTALGLVKDHPQALEYYGYVLDNRAALEESFQLAADVQLQEDKQIELSEPDPDAEFDKRPSSFAGGSVAPGIDGRRSSLDPLDLGGDSSVLEPLGEDDATPVIAIPVEEPTSRIGRDLLQAQLDELRGDEEDEDIELFSEEEGISVEGDDSTPVVGGLPHILLQEAAEDDAGSRAGKLPARDAASHSPEDEESAADKGESDEGSASSGEGFIVITDDDYAGEMDLNDNDANFAWEEGPSVKAGGGQVLEVELSDASDDDDEDDSDENDLLLLDPGGTGDIDDAQEVDDAEVLETSPVDELLNLSADEPEEDELVDDDGSVGSDENIAASGPEIPDLPRIPLTAPFDGLQDSSEDKSWVKEELERVSSAQELDADLPSLDSEDSLNDLDMGGLEVISNSGAGSSPIKEVRSLMHDGKLEDALTACERILRDVPDDKIARETQAEIKEQLQEIFSQRIGDLEEIPTVQVPRHEIVWQNLDHRTGFLLSRIDGFLTYQDIVDVSGMEEFEAFRIIVGLLDEEIIGAN